MEQPILSENEKIALRLGGDTTSRVMSMNAKSLDELVKENNIDKFNKEIDVYAEAFQKHTEELEESVNKLSMHPEDLEIMPIGNYVLVKEFKTNPFQRIVKSSSGLILDTGGMAPVFKNTDSGEFEQEEEFILTGAVQEVGPECKWIKPGDAVMFTRPSAVPVPFYKAGLTLVNETRILVVVNEGLTKRFNELKK